MNPKVDAFLSKPQKWQEEMIKLREILLGLSLTEDLKWGVPCYSLDGANIVLIHAFKEYCAALFFKGALLTDPDRILVQQTENTQAARQIRYTSIKEVAKLKSALKAFVKQAINIEKNGLKVEFKKTDDFAVADEFQTRLKSDKVLKAAFESLTPGRQRAYLLHFGSAKQSQTRISRIEKCAPLILAGKGLND